jgi:hypothetical protein
MSTSNIEIGHCRKCKTPIYQGHPVVWCEKCNEPLSDDINAKRKPAGRSRHEVVLSVQPASSTPHEGQTAINALRIFAWLNLIGGVIVAILLSEWMWGGTATSQQATLFNIVLGIVFLAEGVFGCAFLLVICSIAENLIAIRRNTEIIPSDPASITLVDSAHVNRLKNQ